MYDEATVRRLTEQLEERDEELRIYRETIADVVELLGHEGCEPVDLRDAVGQIERLLDLRDLEVEGFTGLARRLQALMT